MTLNRCSGSLSFTPLNNLISGILTALLKTTLKLPLQICLFKKMSAERKTNKTLIFHKHKSVKLSRISIGEKDIQQNVNTFYKQQGETAHLEYIFTTLRFHRLLTYNC